MYRTSTVSGDERLVGIALACLSLAVLVVGEVTPDPRVTVGGLPLNSWLYILALMAFVSPRVPWRVRQTVFVASLPILIVVASTLWSSGLEQGLAKSGNLYLCSLIAAGLLAAAIVTTGMRNVLLTLLVLLGLLLFVALITKSRTGFFSRTELYGLLGPIVFARLMGVAAIIAVLSLSGVARGLVVFVFLTAVAWTQSKGPLLSVLVVMALIPILEQRGLRRLAGPAVVIGFVALLYVIGSILVETPIFDRLVQAASFLEPGSYAANYGSIGSRIEAYSASLQLMESNPLGVGAGAWANATGMYYLEYPHNFLLEVLSEMGILLAPIVVLPYLAFVVSSIRELRYLAVFLALAQLTSGDLLDSRMWLAVSLAAIAIRPTSLRADATA